MSDAKKVPDPSAGGEPIASEDLLPLLYGELRKLAAARMANEWDTCTLQPTALVHEAWLRLAGAEARPWQSQKHFFAAAAEAMRRILIDHARRKLAVKRGRRAENLDLDRIDVAAEADPESLLAIHEALNKLAAQDPVSAELVKLRFFAGMRYEEAAKVLEISERSAKRYWAFARAWLYRELKRTGT